MSDDDKIVAYGANSLALWSNMVVQTLVAAALFYAAYQFDGGTAALYYGLGALTAIGVLVTAVVKVIVDVALTALRKKTALDKAKQR